MTEEQVLELLEKTEKGKTMQTVNNCVIALEHDPVMKKGIKKNVLTGRVDIVKNMGWDKESITLNDDDMAYLKLMLEMKYDLRNEKKIYEAIRIVADKNKYHPIKDYLEDLEWDGTERIRYVLHKYLGADTSDMTYESLKLFMLGAVHRIYEPGCKFEYMLCLVGSQGAGKSTFFRFLALQDEWFSDDLRKLDDDNVYRKMQGHWIIELAEMLATSGAKTIEETKAFISRQKETYKVPYDRYPQDRPRQCVFAGTSNKKRFLPFDRTGNRRFLPVETNSRFAECHVLDDEKETRAYMKQLWAEIMVIYQSKDFSLTLSKEMSKEMDVYRNQFMAEDTNAGIIQDFLDRTTHEYVCTNLLYQEALGNLGNPDRRVTNEINDILHNVIDGWIEGPTHRFKNYGTQRSWVRMDSLERDISQCTKVEFRPMNDTEVKAVQMDISGKK